MWQSLKYLYGYCHVTSITFTLEAVLLISVAVMSAHNNSDKRPKNNLDKRSPQSPLKQPLLVEENSWGHIIIEVPAKPMPPELPYRPALNRPYRDVGLEADPLPAVTGNERWQAWVVFAIVAGGLGLGAIALVALGDWLVVLMTMPVLGLLLFAVWRNVQEEQQVYRRKMRRRARRLRDMEEE